MLIKKKSGEKIFVKNENINYIVFKPKDEIISDVVKIFTLSGGVIQVFPSDGDKIDMTQNSLNDCILMYYGGGDDNRE